MGSGSLTLTPSLQNKPGVIRIGPDLLSNASLSGNVAVLATYSEKRQCSVSKEVLTSPEGKKNMDISTGLLPNLRQGITRTERKLCS